MTTLQSPQILDLEEITEIRSRYSGSDHQDAIGRLCDSHERLRRELADAAWTIEQNQEDLDVLDIVEAVAERFAAGWTPDADQHGRAVWLPPKACGSNQPTDEPEFMDRPEAEWFVCQGWAFATNQPANQVRIGLEVRGWRPARVKGRWRMVDAAGKVVPYAKVSAENVRVLAGGQDLTDDELEARIDAHRRPDGDAYDKAGVPWLRDLLGGPNVDPRIDPIPWPPHVGDQSATAPEGTEG